VRLKACFSAVAVLLLAGLSAEAQLFRGFQAASILPPEPVKLKPGAELKIPLVVRVRPGYHINSDKPREEYLIPTTVTWEAPALKLEGVDFPEAEIVKYSFSDEPLSVFSGEIVITSRFRVPAKVPAMQEIRGTLRYQACNDKSCLAPTNVDFAATVLP
jgi:hypothetical protein